LEGVLFFLVLGKLWKRGKRRRKIGRIVCFGELSQGTVVFGNFGLRGEETVRVLGARESERLFVVGWEVNIQFGQFGQEQEQIEKGLNQPTCRSRYVLY
jgi:hypothetical protein